MFLNLLPNFLPLLLLLILGYLFKIFHFLNGETINQIKKIIVTITLPCLLFLAFFSLNITPEGLLLGLVIFSLCATMLFIGKIISRQITPKRITLPFLFCGFEAGMLGYALYLSLFGQENLPIFAAVDLGQVLFVFLILVPLLKKISGQTVSGRETLLNAISSPVLLSIIAGLILGGVARFSGSTIFSQGYLWAFVESLNRTIQTLGNLTPPLVAITVGYGLQINGKQVLSAVVLSITRLIMNSLLAWTVSWLISFGPINLSAEYIPAIWVLFLLPPPYVIPAFLPAEANEEESFISTTLSVHTLLSIFLIPLVFVFLS